MNQFKTIFEETGVALIDVPLNLNLFLKTLIARTNLEDSSEVNSAMHIINQWIESYIHTNDRLPTDINYHELLLMTLYVF